MSSDQLDDHGERAEIEDEFDADDPDDYGHVPAPARRRRSRLVCGEVTARFADGSLWLTCTGDPDTPHHVGDCTGVLDTLTNTEDSAHRPSPADRETRVEDSNRDQPRGPARRSATVVGGCNR